VKETKKLFSRPLFDNRYLKKSAAFVRATLEELK
jgi:hypothetical protein